MRFEKQVPRLFLHFVNRFDHAVSVSGRIFQMQSLLRAGIVEKAGSFSQ